MKLSKSHDAYMGHWLAKANKVCLNFEQAVFFIWNFPLCRIWKWPESWRRISAPNEDQLMARVEPATNNE